MIGHAKIREKLGTLVASSRLPSALLFSGIGGIGKRLAAHELTKKIFCGDLNRVTGEPCGTCPACTLSSAGNHPDLHFLDCGGEDSSVDSVRELLGRLSLTSFKGGARVAILDNADHLNAAGANALLKSLEEPRPGVYFILIAETASRLPPTVLSRCQKWHFERLTDAEVESVLSTLEQKVTPEIARLAEGSVKSALTLSDSSLPVDGISGLMRKIAEGDTSAIMDLVRTVTSEKDSIPSRIAILRTQARLLMEEHIQDSPSAHRWSLLLANVIEAERLLFDRNFNATATLYSILANLSPNHSSSFMSVARGGTLGMEVF